ncbi:MAG: hypothetical protein ACTSRA_09895 [Promethearchaeota archaeon]
MHATEKPRDKTKNTIVMTQTAFPDQSVGRSRVNREATLSFRSHLEEAVRGSCRNSIFPAFLCPECFTVFLAITYDFSFKLFSVDLLTRSLYHARFK